MTAVLRSEQVVRAHAAPMTRTALRLDDVVSRLPATDLGALESQAALLTRVDRKYIVPLETFARLVEQLGSDWRALQIGDSRIFGYASTYFDTAALHTYRAHLQGRRRRFKVRVRHYTESDLTFLEVKRKGLRGLTIKERTAHPAGSQAELGPSGRAFVAETLRGRADLPDQPLHPVLTVRNRRATLASFGGYARLTVDTDVAAGRGDTRATLAPGYVLVESKVGSQAHGRVDRILRSLGERPVEVSKYCIGVAALGLDIPSNPWRRTLRRYFTVD